MSTRKNTLRKEAKHAQRMITIRNGYADAAEIMGVAPLFDELPRFVKEWLWRLPILEPIVGPDDNSVKRLTAPVIQAELRQRLKQATIDLEDGTTYPVSDLLTFGLGIRQAFQAILAKRKEPDLRRLASQGLAVVRPFLDRNVQEAVLNLSGELRAGAAEHARIDTELISFTITWQKTPNDKLRAAVVFTLTDPQPREFHVDGQARTAYRCGGHRGPHVPLEWVSWPAATLNIEGQQADYPVYVQKHALRRVEERLKELGLAAAHFWLWESLRKPCITKIEGDQYTIEYRFLDFRLGYLLARRIGDQMLVTTFMFLTMEGSPEARLLYETLRLRRSDIEYQSLDALRTFTDTDLLDDPELLEIFRRCGCGHLADLRKRLGHEARAYAAELRKYLRLDERRNRQGLAERMKLEV